MLQYYSSDASMGVLLYLMTFIYGAIWWLITAGLVTSVGIIIDVYINERDSFGKVIVFPFFVVAIGLILNGASVYILSVSGVQDFPMSAATTGNDILYSTLAGLISAVAGVIIQYFVTKKIAEQRKQAIIEVL